MPGRYGYAPDPGTVTPYPGAPRFFVRAYDLSRSFIMEIPDMNHPDRGTSMQRLYDPGILPIWGFACQSSYAEDKPQEKFAWEQNGHFMAWCFSTMEPRGEIGFVPKAEVVEVSQEEFEAALTKMGIE